MKKFAAFVLCIIAGLAFCACSGSHVKVQGNNYYSIDTKNHTVFDGTYTYRYSASGSRASYIIKIYYPDGSMYTSGKQGGMLTAGLDTNLENRHYADGEALCMLISQYLPRTKIAVNPLGIICGIIVIIIGIYYIKSPERAWHWSLGRWFKNAEPSDMALIYYRIAGVLLIIIGIVMFFI